MSSWRPDRRHVQAVHGLILWSQSVLGVVRPNNLQVAQVNLLLTGGAPRLHVLGRKKSLLINMHGWVLLFSR